MLTPTPTRFFPDGLRSGDSAVTKQHMWGSNCFIKDDEAQYLLWCY